VGFIGAVLGRRRRATATRDDHVAGLVVDVPTLARISEVVSKTKEQQTNKHIINTLSERSPAHEAGEACRSETNYNLDLTTGGLIVDKSVRARSSMSQSSCAALSAMRNLDEPTATVGGRIAGT